MDRLASASIRAVERLSNSECSEEISYDVIGAATQAVENHSETSASWSMGVSVKCVATTIDMAIIPMTIGQIKQDQRHHLTIGPMIQRKLAKQKPSGPELKQFDL